MNRISSTVINTLVLLHAAVLCLSLPGTVYADLSVSLGLDRSEATLSDSIRMVVTVSGTRKSTSPPALRGVDLFLVTQGGTSSRVEIVNGQVNASVDYVYFLQPRHTGSFKIGPAEVTIKGKTYRSDTARLMVSKPEQASGQERGPIFLVASLSSEKAYAEEQLLYTLKLYRRVSVRDLSLSLPEIEHLAFTQLGEPKECEGSYSGKPYQVLEVRYAVVPSKPGTQTVAPARMNMTVLEPGSRGRGSIFDDRFFPFTRGRPLTLTSEAFEIKVSPLPEAGRPADFSGLVGRYEMVSELEPSTLRAGESATLTVRVSGRGNVTLIPDLKIPEQAEVKIYADQPVLKTEQDAQGIGGGKTMKWALVPEKAGQIEIPPLQVSYFDTETRGYRTLKTPARVLFVLPGKEEKIQVAKGSGREKGPNGPSKEAVRELGRDILPVHADMKDFAVSYRVSPEGWFFWILLLSPALAYGIAVGAVRFRRKSLQSLPATRARKAARDFMRRCRRGAVSSREAIDALRDYLNRRFNLSIGALTPDDAMEILASRGGSRETAEKMGAALQRLEDAVYTGKGEKTCETVEDLATLIRTIEKEVR